MDNIAAAALARQQQQRPTHDPRSPTPPSGTATPVIGNTAAAAASPRGTQHGVVPPPLEGGDESRLAAIMARQRQAADSQEELNYHESQDEVTVETFEEIIDEEHTEIEEVVEEVVEEEEEIVEEEDETEERTVETDDDGGELEGGQTPEMSQSEMSVEEFQKDVPIEAAPTPQTGSKPPLYGAVGQSPHSSQAGAQQLGPQTQNGPPPELAINLDENSTGNVVAPTAVPAGVQPDVDEQTPQDGSYGAGSYGAGGSYEEQNQLGSYQDPESGGDPYDQPYDNYNQEPYGEVNADGTDEYGGADYGVDAYGQPTGYGQEEEFQDEEQPLPPDGYPQQQSRQMPAEYPTKPRDEEEEGHWLGCCVIVACLLLIVAMAGVGVILYFWLADDPFDDDPTTRTVVITTAPTPPPTPTPAPRTDPLPTPNPTPTPPTAPTTPPPTPVPTPATFTLTNTLTSNNAGSAIGQTVAVAGQYLFAGEPGFGAANVGRLGTFSRSGGNSSFDSEIAGTSGGSEEYGDALDVTELGNGNIAALVGASRTPGQINPAHNFGAAYYMVFDGTTWNNLGGAIRCGESLEEAGGKCGEAVAIATDIQRVVIASPSSSKDIDNLDTGRLHSFDYSDGAWNMVHAYIEGPTNSFLGQSLDMTTNGERLIAGAPGNTSVAVAGFVNCYEWDDDNNTWNEVSRITGTAEEGFGRDVQIIQETSAGYQFIVGGPTLGSNKNSGVAAVYFKETGSDPVPVGSPILGAEGDELGKTVGGSNGKIIIGTNNDFRVMEYNGQTDQWENIGGGPVSTPSSVLSVALTSDGKTAVVGMAGEVRVYDL